ncbi:hypothetical protein DPMN_183638 [Dreissena polymorpha]|uniref:Uncharacterized protein n=1 Tax=Dreissena polymorpha TaxID=45954 RepID=A0A9D4DGD0_DREPO|nr:hypothetical protein DPMN_183638 [Dreissena polymorpha]
MSRLQKIDISRLDLLRMAQQIQLSPSPSSRTSSSLLRLLSSPGCSGSDQSAVYRREFACPYRSRGPVC